MLKHHHPQQSSIITKTAVSVATVFLAAIFLLIFGITYLNSYWMHHRILTDKQEFVNEISRSIDDQFKSLTTPLVSLGNQSAVHRLLNSNDTYDSSWLANIREVETSISQIHIYYDHVVDLVIMNTDSKILFSVTNALSRNYDFTGSDWFQKALEQPSAIKYVPPHGVDHYSRQNEKYANVFSVIYPVKKADKVEGYILCEVNANKISSLFYGTSIHSAEGYIMVDEDGKLIYDYVNDRSPDEIGDIWTAINRNRTTDTPMQTILNGNLYTSKQIQTTRWFIISETSNEIIRSSANSIWSFAIVIGCAAVGFCILILRYITRRLQKPVDSVIERISSYDGSGAVAFDDMDNSFREITVIRSKFEEMAGKINSLINDVYVAQMHQKDIHTKDHFLQRGVAGAFAKPIDTGVHHVRTGRDPRQLPGNGQSEIVVRMHLNRQPVCQALDLAHQIRHSLRQGAAHRIDHTNRIGRRALHQPCQQFFQILCPGARRIIWEIDGFKPLAARIIDAIHTFFQHMLPGPAKLIF